MTTVRRKSVKVRAELGLSSNKLVNTSASLLLQWFPHRRRFPDTLPVVSNDNTAPAAQKGLAPGTSSERSVTDTGIFTQTQPNLYQALSHHRGVSCSLSRSYRAEDSTKSVAVSCDQPDWFSLVLFPCKHVAASHHQWKCLVTKVFKQVRAQGHFLLSLLLLITLTFSCPGLFLSRIPIVFTSLSFWFSENIPGGGLAEAARASLNQPALKS